MLKLKKYLKPYLLGVFFAILLLFGQAFADLNLPNYMSDIVNVGIQQNGIEYSAPEVISENGFNLMLSFMTSDEKDIVKQHYTLTNVSDYKGYTLVTNLETIYVRGSVSHDELDTLDAIFGRATWTMISFFQEQSGQSGGSITSIDTDSLDMNQLYQLIPMVSQLPESTIVSLRESNSVDASIMTQSGMVLSRAFYTELGINISNLQRDYIINIGIRMLGIAFLGGLATVLVSLLSSRIAAGVARDLRHDVFEKVESFSNAEFDNFSTASLITRTTNDITQIQMLIGMGIRMLCYAPIMAIGGTYMALRQSTSMAWIIALACLILILLIGAIMVVVMPKFKSMQKLVDNLNLVSRENLSGLMVIRAFATQDYEKGRFEDANDILAKTSRFVNRAMNTMMPAMSFVMNGVTLMIVWVGAHQIANSSMQVGDMMAFIQYAMQIIMSFLMITMMFVFVPRAAVSADRIMEVLETEVSIVDPKQPQSYEKDAQGIVEFKHVSFRYGDSDEDTLRDISFVAKPGETTAIIGPTGSGKSTIASLLLRFYDVTTGEINVDNINVKDVTQHDLRERIGYVPQKGVLLSGTIESNLRYGAPQATQEGVHASARVAQAAGFISEKEDGYDSLIAQGGTNVSGGQKQRLSIARALTKNPDIFVFDDSFSALDFKTDAILRKELKEYTGDATMIIVAQRVNTIMNADQIIVLEDGVIVGKGTHKELLSTCPQYYEIASSQLSEEELNG
ncbi:ABC transporter [Erysipelothrix larvae]|uniref:ABC transporter n=1 Tax=Erysipelothrix larvae TaxID=1514105 RepID=A0A0X8H052_9FIRM|nr:ABC transporter ATP-binding protein [Erysipelothrix larvae]AMC93606.1 ABC transporter [Erysipelothrix larvae]